MNPEASAEGRRWSVTRWLGVIALVFLLQLACIFRLSDRPPSTRASQSPVPVFRLADASWAHFLALTDPTWFALPHRDGFSGLVWMHVPQLGETNAGCADPVGFHAFTYSNPPEWLRPRDEQPGLTFCEFVLTNHSEPTSASPGTEMALTLPEVVKLPLSREDSALRVEGELARRPLLSRLELRSQPATSLLTNSVVQVVVDAAGRTLSAALIKSSGLPKADQEALACAAVVRFAPAPGGRARPALTPGCLIFEWHTVPDPSANPASSGL